MPQQYACIPVPNPCYANADNVARRSARLGFAELLAAVFIGRDPATYTEAMWSVAADEWTEACQYEMNVLTVTCTTHTCPTWTQDESGNKTRRRSWSDQGLSQEVGNLETANQMVIEGHQAGELGVQLLHYLYKSLKATLA